LKKLINEKNKDVISHIISNKQSLWENNGAFSFIDLKDKEKLEENVNAEELNKLESNLKEMFMAQLVERRKKRYTEDGRLCAAAFVQDGVTYFDCTSARAPDGSLKNREWCYVEIGTKGSSWAYCKPIMDYDKVREANQKFLSKLTVECRKINDEIEQYVAPASEALNDLKKLRSGQAELDNRVNIMIRDVETLHNSLSNLVSLKTKWEIKEKKSISKFS
jgi:predicted nuclease with TOPRIM domain